MWDVGCGKWDVECGMLDVKCGMWNLLPLSPCRLVSPLLVPLSPCPLVPLSPRRSNLILKKTYFSNTTL